jgi:hypothetical protein
MNLSYMISKVNITNDGTLRPYGPQMKWVSGFYNPILGCKDQSGRIIII